MKGRRLFGTFIFIYVICFLIFGTILYKHLDGDADLTAREKEVILQTDKLVLVGDHAFPPLSFTENGQVTGYEADLIKALEAKLGLQIKYQQMHWSDAVAALQNGEVAAITGMRITDERKTKYHFTEPYWKTSYSLIGQEGTDFSRLLEDPDIAIVFQKDSATYQMFWSVYDRMDRQVLFVDEPVQALDLILTGEADLWVESYIVGLYTAMKRNATSKLEYQAISGSNGDYAMAFNPKYSHLVPIFNKALREVKADGTLANLDKNWFGLVNVRPNPSYHKVLIAGFIFAILTIILIYSLINMALKKMVWDKAQKEAEAWEKVRASEQFSKTIIDKLPAGVAVLNEKGIVITANKKWTGQANEKPFVRSLSDVGEDFLQIFQDRKYSTDEVIDQVKDGIFEVMSGEKPEFDLEYPFSYAGISCWMYLKVLPMSTRNPRTVLVIQMDITQSKTAARTLEQNEARYRATVENTGTAMMIIDEDTSIALANNQMEVLTGYTLEELSHMSWTTFVYDDDLERMLNYHYSRRMGDGMADRQYEFRLVHKNGTILSVFITVNMISGTRQSVASLIDITNIRQMEEDLRQSKNKIEKLHEIALKMERCQQEDEVYRLIIDAAEGVLKFNFCTVDIVQDGYFVVKATSSRVPNDVAQSFSINEGIAGKTYREGRTFLLRDVVGDQDAKPAKTTYRSAISTPLGDFGVFQVISEKVAAFDEEDVEMAELLVSHAAEAIKRIRSEAQIKYMSFHDSMTGLYNRAFFDEELKRLDSKRQLPLSIIMGDVNALKLVNDVFGHYKGDEYICKIANIFKEACRQEDIVTRWGGDEFAVLLPKTTKEEAKHIARRIKEACKKADTEFINPSISLGISMKEQEERKILEVVEEAENQMYKAKLSESKEIQQIIIASLEKILWEKSYETKEHTERLQKWASYFQNALGFSDQQMDNFHLLASLHDVGKIAIPESILRKRSPLTPKEWELIKSHPEKGYRIAHTSAELIPIADDILSHHERWDGKGYPRGLAGEEIPILARVFAIVDSFDVMTQGRPYRKPLSIQKALMEIRRCSGGQYDPRLVDIFMQVVAERELD